MTVEKKSPTGRRPTLKAPDREVTESEKLLAAASKLDKLPTGLPALGLVVGLQAQWDACYGPTKFGDPNNQPAIDAIHFMQRVSMAMTAAALVIMSEAPATPNHVNRMTLVKSVLGAPTLWTACFAQAFAAHGLDQSSTDSAISSGPALCWDGFAGPP